MSLQKAVVIVGGHGKIALRLARLLSPTHAVTSVIRTPAHEPDIRATGAAPLLLSLEDAPASDFAAAFTGARTVVFSAGAGGQGGEARTKAVDYAGAVKVFDALEKVEGPKPRLLLVSSIDTRDPAKVPAHYNDDDLAVSARIQSTLGTYIHWKYEADKDLVRRTAFPWVIVRPGGLSNEAGTGTADVGRTHIARTIARDDVAQALALLVDHEDAAGLVIDVVGGDTPLPAALDAALARGGLEAAGYVE